jgi:hypothetical protein
MNEHDADLCDDDGMTADEFEMFVDIRTDAMNFAIATATSDEPSQDVVLRAQIYADWISGVFTLQNTYEAATPPATGDNVVDLKRH